MQTQMAGEATSIQDADLGAVHPPPDSGLLSLLMMAQFHGLAADPAKLQHEYGQGPFDVTTLLHAAKSLGFKAKTVRQAPERLHKAPLPCIALDTEGRFFVLAKIGAGQPDASDASPADPKAGAPEGPFDRDKTRLLIQRPGEPPQILSYAGFMAQWSGELIFMTSKASFAGEVSRFDFTWFIPAVVKYRKQPGARHWRTRVDPFADAWSVVEG